MNGNNDYYDMATCFLTGLAHVDWVSLNEILRSSKPVSVDGQTLTVPQVIAVSLHGARVIISHDPSVAKCVQQSVDFLESELQQGRTVYGVNTGFGGSADTRTGKLELLQSAAVQHLNVGILLPSDKGINTTTAKRSTSELLKSHALPNPVVRAMMLIRCNSLLRGHSGVRLEVIRAITTLLSKDMIPVVPLRGSISASGDLSSLSYIAGALEGNPNIYLRVGTDNGSGLATCITAPEALARAGLQPVKLQAKEALGITNGTATSCAAASVAIHQAQQLADLTQFLTAMGTEALLGTSHNYDAFISHVRPHAGQSSAASTIRALLAGSLLSPDKGPDAAGLAQDRYALRTAPQWIGPQLEDIRLARHQIDIELNSTTDNPLIDVAGGRIHHGGNFQAASVTSAMEKTLTALQNLGRLIFAQSTELVNNQTNKGLPPNLAADDPSCSFTFKGFDVNMAAYMAELGWLARPISSHGVSAELGNQSVNSLALVAARAALEAGEVVALMAATYTYALCQALDLRCLNAEFLKIAEPTTVDIVRDIFGQFMSEEDLRALCFTVWAAVLESWNKLSHLDLADRGPAAASDSIGKLMEFLANGVGAGGRVVAQTADTLDLVTKYQNLLGAKLSEVYHLCRRDFLRTQTTTEYIGCGSRAIYTYVRRDLGIPMHRGLVDHPVFAAGVGGGPGTNGVSGRNGDLDSRRYDAKTLGTMASEIYLAIRNGQLYSRMMEAWEALQRDCH